MKVFQKHDAGEVSRSAAAKGRDCQVRGVVSALGIDYAAAWDLLYLMQGERRACSFVLVEALRVQDSRINVVRALEFPAQKGKPRMTARVFAEKHPRGRFILRMAHHVACVKDGKLLDTWDSSDKCVYAAWEIRPRGLEEKGHRAMNLTDAQLKLLKRARNARDFQDDPPQAKGAKLATLRTLQRLGLCKDGYSRAVWITEAGLDALAVVAPSCCGEYGTGSGEHSEECEEAQEREPDECDACDGYGHIREDGTGTVDRRERKCLNCNGTGKRLAPGRAEGEGEVKT